MTRLTTEAVACVALDKVAANQTPVGGVLVVAGTVRRFADFVFFIMPW